MSLTDIPKWWVYILCCADNTLYTGITKDVAKRLNEHNYSSKAAKYTHARRFVRVVYIEPAIDRPMALKREIAIKILSRKYKKQLITETIKTSGIYADKLKIALYCTEK